MIAFFSNVKIHIFFGELHVFMGVGTAKVLAGLNDKHGGCESFFLALGSWRG